MQSLTAIHFPLAMALMGLAVWTVDGLAYLVYSFTEILAPGPASHLTPWVQLPAPLTEGALSLWLLAFGIDVAWWTRQATTAKPPPRLTQPQASSGPRPHRSAADALPRQ